MMTQEEWLSHSEEWRKGWFDYNTCEETLSQKEFEQKPEEYRKGYVYALQNPFGNFYRPM